MSCALFFITSVPYVPSGNLTVNSGELATCYIIHCRSHNNVGKQVSAMFHWATLDDSCDGYITEDDRQSKASWLKLVYKNIAEGPLKYTQKMHINELDINVMCWTLDFHTGQIHVVNLHNTTIIINSKKYYYLCPAPLMHGNTHALTLIYNSAITNDQNKIFILD